MVDLGGLEPPTSRLSGVRSNQLSYRSIIIRIVKKNLNIVENLLLRKEVIQPHLPVRLPCYDFTPVIQFALGGSSLTVRSPTLGPSNFHGVTGGVYKTRERIHRGILIRDY